MKAGQRVKTLLPLKGRGFTVSAGETGTILRRRGEGHYISIPISASARTRVTVTVYAPPGSIESHP